MAMKAAQILELCRTNADVLREDLALMEAGRLKLLALGADATREQMARLRANLSRLQQIMDACSDA
jgi:hypothetical protein